MTLDSQSAIDAETYGTGRVRYAGVACGHSRWVDLEPEAPRRYGRFAHMNDRASKWNRRGPDKKPRKSKLTAMIAAGSTVKEIMASLHLSTKTIAAHRRRMVARATA